MSKISKGNGKEGATPLTHKPGCQAASTDNADADEWSSSDDSASDEERNSPPGESRSSTPTPTLADAGCANARQGSPDPTLDVDRQMSAYEMEKSLEEVSKLIKEEAAWTRRFCEKEARYTIQGNRDMILRRMGTLDKAVEGLAGMAITAANRDKQQQVLLEQISARLTDLEKNATTPPSPPRPRMQM